MSSSSHCCLIAVWQVLKMLPRLESSRRAASATHADDPFTGSGTSKIGLQALDALIGEVCSGLRDRSEDLLIEAACLVRTAQDQSHPRVRLNRTRALGSRSSIA